MPKQLKGVRILGLDSGAGGDVYALAALVGETGGVVGVDMTERQLAVADQYRGYHADVYAKRCVSQHLIEDEDLYGECISGALCWNDFIDVSKDCGFKDPRLVKSRPLTIEGAVLQEKHGARRFFSATYRLFKLDELEPACEDYGQAVRYLGMIKHHRDAFVLDVHHTIEAGMIFSEFGNTY